MIDVVEAAKESGFYGVDEWFRHNAKNFERFATKVNAPHLQRIAELTQRANKMADNLEQTEKRLSEIAFKACANLDTKDTQIAQLRKALQLAKDMMQANDLYLPKTLDVIDKALEETR